MQKRLSEWNAHWHDVCVALARDCKLPMTWPVRPWLFVPEDAIPTVVFVIQKLPTTNATPAAMPVSRITPLEKVVPWQYTSWNREGEREKPDTIPVEMKI